MEVIMNEFVDSLEVLGKKQSKSKGKARTANDMRARKKTGSALVDYFFKVGALRQNPDGAVALYRAARAENVELANRILLWSRDVRGGAGERESFRKTLLFISRQFTQKVNYVSLSELRRIIYSVPEIGRWDDLLIFDAGSLAQNIAFSMIRDALIVDHNGLCAKWMPRKGPVADSLRRHLNLSTPKEYRKLLVALTKVVESDMCKKNWAKINYAHVPSLAHARYKKAFWRHDEEHGQYDRYVKNLKKGKTKINAGAVYPHDVLKDVIDDLFSFDYLDKSANTGVYDVIREQWKALPNYLGEDSILPIVDVSGSMTVGDGFPKPIHVSLSLGLYLSEKNKGPFKNVMLTFSASPKLVKFEGDVLKRAKEAKSMDWGMNTNLHASLDAILHHAVKYGVEEKDMPSILLILSDMQFDRCSKYDDSAIDMMKRKYDDAGYNMPQVVFWNLNAHDNVPVKFNDKGVALVSGFSPAIMTSILSGRDNLTPLGVMLNTIMKNRYDLSGYY
jgi:hypothetical protein